jgi:hypothetical protein
MPESLQRDQRCNPSTTNQQNQPYFITSTLLNSKSCTYPANHTPLPTEPIIEQNPSNSCEHRGQATIPARHDGSQIRTKCRTTIEAQPAEPKDDRTECDEEDIVRPEVEHHFLLALAKHHAVSQSADAGADFDWAAYGTSVYVLT